MSLQMLSTNSFYSDFICYDFLLDTIETIKQDNRLFDKYTNYSEDFIKFKEYYDYVENTFEFNNFSSYDGNIIHKSLFKRNIYPEIDTIEDNIIKFQNHYDLIIKELSKIIDRKSKKPVLKLEYNDRFDWKLTTTKNRSKIIQKYLETKNIVVKDDDNKILFEITKDELSFKHKDTTGNFIV